MLQDTIKENENVQVNSKEMEALKEHFPQCFDANGKFHFNRSQPICYSHGAYYTLGESVGTFGYSVRKKTPIAKQMGRTTKKRQRNSSRRSHNSKKHKGE